MVLGGKGLDLQEHAANRGDPRSIKDHEYVCQWERVAGTPHIFFAKKVMREVKAATDEIRRRTTMIVAELDVNPITGCA
jgi:hypothetical protein